MPFGTPVGSKGRSASAATIATGAVDTRGCNAFVIGLSWTGAPTFTSIVDSNGNTYTQIGAELNPSAGSDHARFYRCASGVSSASHTATLTISAAASIEILFIGIPGISGFDTSNGNVDTATPFTSPSITPSQARALLVSYYVGGDSVSNPATHAESTGFTIVSAAEETNGASFWTGCLATRVVSNAGPFNSSFTETGTTRGAVFIASFLELPGNWLRTNLATPGKHPGPRRFTPVARGYATTSTGVLVGSSTLTFAPTGVLTGAGALTGTATLTFTPTATLTGNAPISGSSTLTFTPTGTIQGIGALTGSSTLTFSPAASLTGSGALSGSTTLTFAPTATLAGTGALTGTATITFSPTGTLTDASGGAGALTGSSSLTFTAVGVLTGTGSLSGATTLTFSPTGILTDANGPIVTDPYPKPAGGTLFRKKPRKKYEVEIDGQVFPVESVDDAQALLDRARELAIQQAQVVADETVRRKIDDKPPVNKPIRVPVPQIHTDNQELVEIVIRARHAIAKIYREQAMMTEIRLRMEQQMRDDDDEAVVILLL